MTPNVLKGHTLPFEGRVMGYHGPGSGWGHGRCSCGAKSEVALETTAARKRWHRKHKDEVRRMLGIKP